MMISSIQIDKRPLSSSQLAATASASSSGSPDTSSRMSAARRHQLAPLASLDCSITEPLTDTHTSTTETPTLSGYFDCDQLSDMVDDSLFEITNAGCLSKSVFSNQKARASPIGEEVSSAANVDIGGGDGNYEDADQASGSLTPTNEKPTANGLQQHQREIPSAIISGGHQAVGQVAMVAGHRAYDYSSTSTIPAQSTRWAQGNGGHRQRSRSARFVSSQGNSAPKANECEARVIHKSRRKARSNPDVRDQHETRPEMVQRVEASQCLECRQLAQEEDEFSTSTKLKKKEKKRFTFSLFNIFSGASAAATPKDNQQQSNNDNDKKTKNGEICTHRHFQKQTKTTNGSDKIASNHSDHQYDSQKASVSSARRRSSRTKTGIDTTNGTSGSSKIKSRDSIRLMNQKRQREIRLSQTFADFQDKNNPPSELLLDLSEKKPPASVRSSRVCLDLRPSQSSYSVMKNDYSSSEQNNGTGNSQQRPTKSVKFTMQDKVMIMPSGPRFKAPGSSNPPPAYLQPSAPIIKRSVPKSSSFSQTESNRSLEELLARYEVNNELITELNERLKLTETIASPISALDQLVISDQDIDYQENHSKNFGLRIYENR